MLVLQRSQGEGIVLFDENKDYVGKIVVKKTGRNVSIALEFHKDIKIIREELLSDEK